MGKMQRDFPNIYLDGIKRDVARRIWAVVRDEWFPGLDRDGIARQLGIDSATVSRGLDEGELSMAGLILILTHSRRSWVDLPPIPPPDVRMASGRKAVRRALGLTEDADACLR